MGLSYIEVPITDLKPPSQTLFLNKTLGAMTCSAQVSVQGSTTLIGYPRTSAMTIAGDSNANQHYPPTPYSGQVTGHVISSSGYFPIATYDNNPVAWMGRFDYVVIGGNWETWTDNGTYDRGLLYNAIKSICNVGNYQPTFIAQYMMVESLAYGTIVPANETQEDYATNEKWYLYGAAGEAGTPVAATTGLYETNCAVAWPNAVGLVAADQSFATHRVTSPFDGNPEDYEQFCAEYVIERVIARHSSFTDENGNVIAASAYTDPRFYPNLDSGTNYDQNKAPHMDALYCDNSWLYPRYAGYYDLQNSYSSAWNSPVGPWMARGYQHFANRMQKVLAKCYPGRTYYNVFNGLGAWIDVYLNSPSVFTAASNGMVGYMHGGWLEKVIGSSYSIEANHGWSALMQGYYTMMDFCVGPKVLGFAGVMSSSTDWQTARYITASASMSDGYANVEITGNYEVGDNLWLDEFGGNPGTDIPKWWLGQPLTARPTAAAINGVWIRDFEHGTVLVNPRNNGTQTITDTQINNYLGKSYTFKHFTGVQNPTLNNGQVATSLTLNAPDGGFLRH